MALLAVSLFALAEMTIFVYQKDGAKVEYLAANVDSIGFVNFHTIVFDANGGEGSVDALRVKESESVNLPANIFTKSAFAFAGWNTAADGSGTAYTDQSTITPTANITLYAQWEAPTTGTENGHEWVDLGLPSGTKWATCNVGADSPEEYGDYFAWGETTAKYSYTSYNYTYSGAPTTLPLRSDAANVNWEGDWRLPTIAEQAELIRECTWTLGEMNGVNGYTVIGPNGNSIFFPGAGNYQISNVEASYGYYWSSSVDTEFSSDAYYIFFNSSFLLVDSGTRYIGRSIRPVLGE